MKKLLLIIAYAISLNLYADRKVFMTAGGDVEFHHDGGYLYIGRLMKIDTISCLPSDQICYSAGIIKKQWEILKCPDSLLSDSYYQQAIACPNVSVDVIKSNANPGNTRAEITQNERFFGAVMHIQSTGERVTYVKSKFWSSMIKSFPVDNNDVLRPTVILEILFIFLLSIIVVQKLRSRIIERNDITNNLFNRLSLKTSK